MRRNIQLTLMIIFSGYLIWLGITGFNSFYISERYYAFNLVMSIILFVYMGIGLWRSFINKKDEDSEISINSSWLLVSAFIFLLFIGIIIIPQPVTAGSASNRNLNVVNNSNLSSDITEFSPFLAPDTEKLTISEWVKLLNYTDRYDQFEDQKVNVIGFVFQFGQTGNDFDKDDENFRAGRFIVNCCAVDASPVGILIDNKNRLDNESGEVVSNETHWLSTFDENDWVNIQGEWKLTEINGEEQLIVVPSEITLTDVPNQPYEF